MRLALAIALAILLLPIAQADQSIAAGPATLSMTNADYGDGCGGTNGGTQREVQLRVDDPRPNGGWKAAGVGSACNSYDDGTNEFEGSYLYVYYTDIEFGAPGPSASYGWYGGSANGSSWCGSWASTGTLTQNLGCPSPDGSAPPMLPVLP